MTNSLEYLRRQAKALRKAHAAGAPDAHVRVAAVFGDRGNLAHADALHVIAREEGFASWPRLKAARDAADMDRAAQAERLKMALYLGQHWITEALLAEAPDLGRDNPGLMCALYDVEGMTRLIEQDPAAATRLVGVRSPVLHLAFSQHWRGAGDQDASVALLDLLLDAGADPNDSYPHQEGSDERLPALYGAIGHAGNIALARRLLERGANPNDNESLYHSTELGHRDGLRLLLEHGAEPQGTNALLRAIDFDDHEAVRLLLEAGADPDEGREILDDGTDNWRVPALHQVARRHASGDLAALLLAHGADPERTHQGLTAYAFARVYGNRAVAEVLEAAGHGADLAPALAQLARAADGDIQEGDYIDMARLPKELTYLLTRLVWREGTLGHIKRLVAMGFDPNLPDEMGMPPLHMSGWEGMVEKTAFFLSLQPDLGHVNGYGGTFFSTILHGADNCPQRDARDHIGCMELALNQGVAIPRKALKSVYREDMASFLQDWAAARPGQVVEDGIY